VLAGVVRQEEICRKRAGVVLRRCKWVSERWKWVVVWLRAVLEQPAASMMARQHGHLGRGRRSAGGAHRRQLAEGARWPHTHRFGFCASQATHMQAPCSCQALRAFVPGKGGVSPRPCLCPRPPPEASSLLPFEVGHAAAHACPCGAASTRPGIERCAACAAYMRARQTKSCHGSTPYAVPPPCRRGRHRCRLLIF
jgi:hypothetical protein